ncbi:MAG: hypothetical protein M1820_009925 [Bogoriella megaspora]|nr:MAG: hypothetical protein M1820_009925 [Bogoriella megaspora]
MLSLLSFQTLISLGVAVSIANARPQAAKPPAFFLAGDSTTAKQSTGGGGWGDGFINDTLTNGAMGKNFGHNGATTVSFRNGGDWSRVLGNASASAGSYSPYITIQFGHNDQKPTANIPIAQFTANLVQFVKDAKAVGATPILVTSLSRRNYATTSGGPRIVQDLADVRNGTIAAAQQSGAAWIDLNIASVNYLNAIGPDNAYTYDLGPTDHTHLNWEGSVIFGNLVATLLDQALPSVSSYVKPQAVVAQALKDGTYYYPPGCTGSQFCGICAACS